MTRTRNVADIIKQPFTTTLGTSNYRAGVNAGNSIASGGNFNVVVGDEAGTAINTGDNNIAIGYAAGDAINTGSLNTYVGSNAGSAATSVSNNTAVGAFAFDAGTGAGNTAVGSGALGNASNSGADNVAVGLNAGNALTTATRNVLIGTEAGDAITTGSENVIVGRNAGGALTTGATNTFVGSDAGTSITSGANNSILGRYNGNQGGLDIRTSSNNIVLSDGAGNPRVNWDSNGKAQFRSTSNAAAAALNSSLISGDGLGASVNIFSARPNNNAFFNFVGSNVAGDQTFTVLGTGNVLNTNNSYGAISDVKLKENIIDASSQWDDIKALTVRKYSMKADNLDAPNMLGVIAQEVEAAGMSGLVRENIDRDEDMNDLGTVTKAVSYSVLYMKAVKALQEAMGRIETLEAKVTALEGA